MGSLVIAAEKTLHTDGQTDRPTGQKHICLQHVRQRHNYYVICRQRKTMLLAALQVMLKWDDNLEFIYLTEKNLCKYIEAWCHSSIHSTRANASIHLVLISQEYN